MSYQKHNFISKQTLTAQALNEIEDGIVQNETAIANLIKRGQLKPEFANNIDECTDTSKLYVLPDGFIYAYITKTVTKKPTNQIKASINSDGTQYVGTSGEDGYKTGYRLNSSGQEVALSTYACTGFIPCTVDDIIRTKNIEFEDTSNSQIHLYDASFASIVTVNCSSATSSLKSIMNDGNVEGSISQATTTLTESQKERIAYIRISALKFNDIAIVTLNESLESSTTTTQGWHSTGHAFVPADYENRIVDLEEKTTSLEEKTTSLENTMNEMVFGTDDTLAYVVEEAKRVAEIVQTNRTVGSLTFTAMSDMHIRPNDSYWADNLTSCRDAGLGLAELQRLLRLDCAVMLGDYTVGGASDTIAQVKEDLTGVRNYMVNGMKGIPNIWCTGNHDINYGANSDRRMTEDELYAYLTSNNTGTTQDSDNIGRNYGYIDFENQKIRCIYLNTIDALDYPDNTGTADDASEVTAVQAQWLVDVGLNLSDKTDAEDWGIVVLSHHCICTFQHVTTILTAYKDGASGSVDVTTNGVTTTVNYNFTSANRGEIICAVHGHDHNFTYRKISTERWDKITEENAWLWSICVPNMDTTRNNEKATYTDTAYAQAFGEFDTSGKPVYYPKIQGTAKSTSFCVITIDRKNRKIHAVAYGAGIDREIIY